MERGYWEIVLRPTKYPETKLTHDDLREILEASQVTQRGWYYPHISKSTKFGDYYNTNDGVEAWVHWAAYVEIFRFYKSGQFVHYMGCWEDRENDHPPMFTEWNPNLQQPPPEQPFLEPISALYTLTEILLFASRLASKNVFGKQVYISIKLHNTLHRILKTVDLRRSGFHYRECHSENIELEPITISTKDLELEHDKLAIDKTIELLTLFNFTSEHLRSSLEKDQKNFHNRTF